jgi:hypothetical protein
MKQPFIVGWIFDESSVLSRRYDMLDIEAASFADLNNRRQEAAIP